MPPHPHPHPPNRLVMGALERLNLQASDELERGVTHSAKKQGSMWWASVA